jgi:hypothetical protein
LLFALLLPKTISYAKNTQLDQIKSNCPDKPERLSRYTSQWWTLMDLFVGGLKGQVARGIHKEQGNMNS